MSKQIIETLKKGLNNKHLSDAQRKSIKAKIESLEKEQNKNDAKKEVKSKTEPTPKYKVGDVLIHNDGFKDYNVKIDAVTGWTGDGHRYEIEFLDENLKPINKFAKSYDDQLSKSKKVVSKKEKVVKQPKEKKETTSVVDYDCDDLIAKEMDKAKKRKAAAEKRKDAPKKKESTKIKEGIEKLEDKVEEKVSKGKITKAEIIKLIDNTKALLKSLEKQLKEFGTKKMAEGGNIEESKFANMSAKDFVKEYSGINVFTSNPSEYFDIQKLATSNDNKVNEFIDKYKKEGYSIKKKSYSDFTHLFAAKRKDFNK